MTNERPLAGPNGANFWWSQLCAVPPTPRGVAYERLKRVWFDQTGCREWFRDPGTECHAVCTLFENMVLFEPGDWVPELLERAGLAEIPDCVTAGNWSYEFEDVSEGHRSIADVVINARDRLGLLVIVIEAKARGGHFKAGDSDPEYYLTSPTFARFGRKYMLYLIDEADRERANRVLPPPSSHRGLITWQQLAGLQISLARRLPDARYGNFIAGAIQYQYCQHDIRPDSLAFGYLAKEPAYEQMPTSQSEPGAQQTQDRRQPIWECE